MNRLYVDLRKIKFHNYNGLALIISLLFALIALCYVIFHNPYKELHEQIFQTAEHVRKYYSDQPGYWKLNTQSAINDRLVGDKLLKSEYAFKIGIGADGETGMPSNNSFDIALSGLNKSSCIGLVEAEINKDQQLGLQKITIINSLGSTDFVWGDNNQPLPVVKYTTRNICQPKENTVLWTFQ